MKGIGKFSSGSLLPGGNRSHQLGRNDDQQLRIVARRRFGLEELPRIGILADARHLREAIGHLAVQKTGDHEALPALQFHFGLHAPRRHAGTVTPCTLTELV